MSIVQSMLFALVGFFASVAGAICGIGGGVIMKPALDLFGWASVSTISFLSGCTVLAMSCYSVIKCMLAKEQSVNLKTATPLAFGAAVGGVLGKQMFSAVKNSLPNPDMVGGVQAACLLVITLLTLLYTLNKEKISTLQVTSLVACGTIGVLLGIMSSFLGIGGGPINLVVLYFFFGMDTKTAAANSLYIILFSQATSFATTLITRTVPQFTAITLVLMVFSGILGGAAGRIVNKQMDNQRVEKLFVGLMGLIILASAYNTWQYMMP